MSNASGVQRPRGVLKFFAILFALVLLAYAAFLVSQSWRAVESEQAKQLATIADLNGNAVDMYFSQLEIAMRNLGASLVDMRNKPDLDRAYTLISWFEGLHTELGNVMLIRGDGQILLTGHTRNSSDLPTLAKDSAFIKFRDELKQGSGFVVGQPVMGHIDNNWVVATRYAVTDQAGKLLYIISANLSFGMLQRYWLDSAIPKITALGLVRDDGYLVSRYPEPEAVNRDAMYGKPGGDEMVAYLRENNFPLQGQVELPGDDGKPTYLRAMRRLQHYPLTLFVEMPMSEIKAAWWEDMHAPYVLMALLLAGAFAYYSLSLRRRHTWSAAERRDALMRSYEQVLQDQNPNEIFMFDAATLQLTYANDFALDKLGYTLEQLQKKTLLSLYPELGIESFGAMIEPLRRGEQESIKYQTVQARADGSAYPVEVSLQLVKPEDGGEGVMAIACDLTALKQAEENIKAFNAPIERRATRRQ